MFNRSSNNNVQHVDVVNYRSQFFNGNIDHTLVDVRTVGEYMGGHVPGAINIPLHELEARHEEIPQEKPVVVICATGNRSRTGARKLMDAGYQTVYNLEGGTMGWMMTGLPLEA